MLDLINQPWHLTFAEALRQPWHWAVSGAAIALITFLMTWLGRSFGMSTTFRNTCTMLGADRLSDFFNVDLKDEAWRMVFALGAVVGGFIAAQYLASPEPVAISEQTIAHLREWGISYPEGQGFLPESIFNFSSFKGIALAVLGGFLVGFGARYGDGCTSGHAISGLSHLQLPSLITVVGFFIGGLVMTHLIMPFLFG